jgi:hypothetical protein
MSTEEFEKDDNNVLLKYRVKKLEELMDKVLNTVDNLDRKVGLLAQKLIIATAIVGVVIQFIGLWYSLHGGPDKKEYTEPEKESYYEKRISESDKIKALESEIARLKTIKQ